MPKTGFSRQKYQEFGQQYGVRLISRTPKATIRSATWVCTRGHKRKTSYAHLKANKKCRQCWIEDANNNWRTATDTMICVDCGQDLPMKDYYLTADSKPRQNKYKRKLATCRLCTDDKTKKYRDKYNAKVEVKQARSIYLKQLRTAPGRCIQCTAKSTLNTAKQCKPCYIKFWLTQAWLKIKRSDWYSKLTLEKQFYIAQSYQNAKTISGQADIANKLRTTQWPDEGLYHIVEASKDPSKAFILANIGWQKKKSFKKVESCSV